MAQALPSPADTPPPEVPRYHAAPHMHRSGAWKVAYADFVTAMMALFIVLWMMNSSAKVKESVQGYFRDPLGFKLRVGTGVGNAGESLALDQHTVRNLRSQIEAALRQMPEFHKIQKNILFSVTGEGLRIDLLENEQGMFFKSGSPMPTAAGEHLLNVLAEELVKMPNKIVIEGHTDARPYRTATAISGYGNWELAADRANAARRVLLTALRPDQIVEMRGFANQRLLNPADPNDPRNRRISVVVKYGEDHAEDAAIETPPATKKPGPAPIR
jgi:chemotaxis protein MotB